VKLSQFGAQLYTVRDHLKDATAFASTIDRLRGFGYCAVELIHSETVNDQEIAQICAAAGIAVAAAHIPGEVIIERPESVAEKLKTVGAKIGVYAFPRGVDFGSRLEVERLADGLEQSAAFLKQEGLTLVYHNHAMEFVRVAPTYLQEFKKRRYRSTTRAGKSAHAATTGQRSKHMFRKRLSLSPIPLDI
jgi:sugar phosphate isomerase/epimerase